MDSEQTDVFRLYLLRHAHAAWPFPGGRDFDRSLDSVGLTEARDVALRAYAAGVSPEIIVSSPARRCAQTTQVFLEVFGSLSANYDDRLYSEGMDAYLDTIRQNQAARSLMLVGHNPMIETLSAFLAPPDDVGATLAGGYPTAGLLAIDFDRPLTGDLRQCGRQALLIAPALT